jgi:hypothetical protein
MAFPGTTLVPVLFSGGLESKTPKFSLDQPYLEDATNVRYVLTGQIQSRPGFTALSRGILGGGQIAAGSAIQTFGNELVLFDGRRVYSWHPDDSVWVDKGSAQSFATGQVRVLNTKIASQSNPDAVTVDDLTLYAWEDDRSTGGEGVRYSVVSQQTGELVVSDQLLFATALRPKVSTYAAGWTVAYNLSANQIGAMMVPFDRPDVASTLVVLAADGQPSTPVTQTIPYDTSTTASGTLFAYASTTGLKLQLLANGFGTSSVQWSVTVDATTSVTTVTVCQVDSSHIWVAWSDASTTFAKCFDGSGSPILGTYTVQTQPSVNLTLGSSPDADGAAYLAAEVTHTGGNYVNVYQLTPILFQYVGQQRGQGLAGKIFTINRDVYVPTLWPSSLQATYFVLCLTQPIGTGPNPEFGVQGSTGFEAVSKHSAQNGGGYRTSSTLSESAPYKQGALFAGQRKGPFMSYASSQGSTLGVAGYWLSPSTNSFNSVTSSSNLHITGGVKKIYDGISVVEDNFHWFPELLSLPAGATFPSTFAGQGCSATLSAGGSLSEGSYQYCIVYTWTDNAGQVERSTPSVATTVVVSDPENQTVVLTIPTLRLTDKSSDRSPVSIEVYRTQANLPIFYKLTPDSSPLVNSVTSDFVTYTDAAADTDIASNENLYTGSQLANTAPPSCSMVSLFQNRLCINSNEDGGVVWYSQNKFDLSQYNTIPLDWNTSFVEGVDTRGGGPVSAIGLLDANLAIFKPTSVYLLSGNGPNALDTQGEFNDAQLLVSDTGCENQNSLVLVTQTPKSPGGLLFKSAKGIYLLGRDSSLTYVGAPVESFNDLTITSANLLARSNEIVFTTEEGTALVYNYYYDAWTTWGPLPAKDAVVWNDQLVVLREEGICQVQDLTGTVWSDTAVTTVPIECAVTLPWLKFAGMTGYQAVYSATLLGQYKGPHIVTAETSYDFNPSVVETVIWNGSLTGAHWGALPIWGVPFGTWGNSTFSTYEFQINFANPRCQAVQLRLSWSGTDSEGAQLNAIGFEVKALPGSMRLPQGNLVASAGRSR